MKLNRIGTIAAALLIALLILPACQENDGVIPSKGFSPDMLLVAPEWMEGDVQEGTLNSEFTLKAENDRLLFDGREERPKEPQRPNLPPRVKLGMLLRALELTEEQRADVAEYLAALRPCVMEARIAMREAQMAIIQEANAQRREVIADLQNGLITREEAAIAIRQINMDVRDAMQNDEDIIAARLALKKCHDDLLSSIYDILTPEQILIWNRFFSIR